MRVASLLEWEIFLIPTGVGRVSILRCVQDFCMQFFKKDNFGVAGFRSLNRFRQLAMLPRHSGWKFSLVDSVVRM